MGSNLLSLKLCSSQEWNWACWLRATAGQKKYLSSLSGSHRFQFQGAFKYLHVLIVRCLGLPYSRVWSGRMRIYWGEVQTVKYATTAQIATERITISISILIRIDMEIRGFGAVSELLWTSRNICGINSNRRALQTRLSVNQNNCCLCRASELHFGNIYSSNETPPWKVARLCVVEAVLRTAVPNLPIASRSQRTGAHCHRDLWNASVGVISGARVEGRNIESVGAWPGTN